MFSFPVPPAFPFLVAAAVFSFFAAVYAFANRNRLEEIYQRESNLPWRKRMAEYGRQFFSRMPPWLRNFLKPADTEEVLFMAGRPFGMTAGDFNAVKMLAAGLAAVFLLTAATTRTVWLVIPVAVVKAPDWWLSYLIKERRKKMDREFFNVASRLAAALAGGLPLDRALKWSAGQTDFEKREKAPEKVTPLKAELLRCIKESEMGLSLDQVFSAFADRTGLLTARRMMVSVLQARRGLPVAQALQDAVDDARERRKQTIIGQAKSAEKKSELALFVMALPALILTVAPMAITLMETSGGLF